MRSLLRGFYYLEVYFKAACKETATELLATHQKILLSSVYLGRSVLLQFGAVLPLSCRVDCP